ncbi:hypothetical protein Acy02nite_85100 [Actinoplanes cyaneus]|uniref:Uncharacterized protein n=1 Tax=Actinoplanes cyaneus TaxID=52696 RepID=A0A919IRW1_9ACTN|nr:hypothetical protein [Actinoplanes cyaneus]MCW2143870.1 hypothetical protein [Actinoplanes cyaneus]GID70629.1 hypothetical protein Acy02nite_85100 [Actinoplanes cyaneus]
MRQRSLSVLIATATGLAMTGLLATPATAMPADHRAGTASGGTFHTTSWDRTTAEIEETSFATPITSWDTAVRGTTVALGAGGDDRPGRPHDTRVWAGGTGAAADARTVNRTENTEETAPSRRPASQFA